MYLQSPPVAPLATAREVKPKTAVKARARMSGFMTSTPFGREREGLVTE